MGQGTEIKSETSSIVMKISRSETFTVSTEVKDDGKAEPEDNSSWKIAITSH